MPVRHPSLALEVAVPLRAAVASGMDVEPANGATSGGALRANSSGKRATRFSPYQRAPHAEPLASIPQAQPTLGLSGFMDDLSLSGPISSRTRARTRPGFKTRKLERLLTKSKEVGDYSVGQGKALRGGVADAAPARPPLPPVRDAGRRKSVVGGLPWHVKQTVLELLDTFLSTQRRASDGANQWKPLRQSAARRTSSELASTSTLKTTASMASLPPLHASELRAERPSRRLPLSTSVDGAAALGAREPLPGSLRASTRLGQLGKSSGNLSAAVRGGSGVGLPASALLAAGSTFLTAPPPLIAPGTSLSAALAASVAAPSAIPMTSSFSAEVASSFEALLRVRWLLMASDGF